MSGQMAEKICHIILSKPGPKPLLRGFSDKDQLLSSNKA